MSTRAAIMSVLERSRWAPSGDNTQPWRFKILSDSHAVVYGYDTRRTVVYDLQGHASQVAVGALLEHISIAASAEGLSVEILRRQDPSGIENSEHPVFDILFLEDPTLCPDPLAPFIESRIRAQE